MKKQITTLFILLLVHELMAQPGMPNNPTPIDGGLGLLIAAGIAYGVIHKYNRKTER
ncbi:PID-CTERM protein-sorting domain-containing protein [Schleiferia thermophila]|jgi:hypothetical protein|uniref:Secreted protein with PEP-CTERM sorting signal n=1 Tax=Schleiferia thermophila TaxID=884107 RepID=A0A369A900_9FLAO|nr:hypothetical protein [Schleiferia thermophila]KFD40348.1 hypothetical protein AT05_02010 [Schleiferia thermophila str. Yellowstone]RCX05623.1 hypothetical protein DES35_101911 [Schleiferia thermophila]